MKSTKHLSHVQFQQTKRKKKQQNKQKLLFIQIILAKAGAVPELSGLQTAVFISRWIKRI